MRRVSRSRQNRSSLIRAIRAIRGSSVSVIQNRKSKIKHRHALARPVSVESRYLALGRHRLHYVDEGAGQPLLFVHGNPTWSFYWRNLIAGLRDQHRCIAVDHIGCGLSDKPQDYTYTLQQRIDDLVTFVERLDLAGVTLLAHDWGGRLGWARSSGCPSGSAGSCCSTRGRFRRRLCRGGLPPAARRLLARWRPRPECLCPGGALDGGRKARANDADVRAGLLAPYDNWAHRVAIDQFVRDIPFSPRHPTWQTLERIESGLAPLAISPSNSSGACATGASAPSAWTASSALAARRSPPPRRLWPLRRRRRPRADRPPRADLSGRQQAAPAPKPTARRREAVGGM
jgi:cis-3-alkyl-4-acyloxetan-2-one decarboxylase